MVEDATTADALCDEYLTTVVGYMRRIQDEERCNLDAAARMMAKQIAADRLVHVFGPGGHSNLATQELFFRAGGLMHMNAILDEGTLLSNGALRSMAIERTPEYGRIIIENQWLGKDDLLILVNAYGINAALIDAALTAREKGVALIGINSRDRSCRSRACRRTLRHCRHSPMPPRSIHWSFAPLSTCATWASSLRYGAAAMRRAVTRQTSGFLINSVAGCGRCERGHCIFRA